MDSPLKALSILKKIDKTVNETNNKKLQGYYKWAIATTYRLVGNINNGIKIATLALSSIYKKIMNKGEILNDMGYIYTALGGLYRVAGNYNKSLEMYENALQFFEKYFPQDYYGIGYSYCGIGNAYRKLEEYTIGIHFLKRALHYYSKINEELAAGYTCWSLGSCYLILGNNNEALFWNNKSKEIFQKTNDKRGILYTALTSIQLNPASNNNANTLTSFISYAKKTHHRIEEAYLKVLKFKLEKSPTGLKKVELSLSKMGIKNLNWLYEDIPINFP